MERIWCAYSCLTFRCEKWFQDFSLPVLRHVNLQYFANISCLTSVHNFSLELDLVLKMCWTISYFLQNWKNLLFQYVFFILLKVATWKMLRIYIVISFDTWNWFPLWKTTILQKFLFLIIKKEKNSFQAHESRHTRP